jgi:4'-phosphopantetheinyl transferase
MVRIFASRYLSLAPQDLRITYGLGGKPSLDFANIRLQFKMSHSESLALYGFAVDSMLGVDVETIRILDMDSIAQTFFSSESHCLSQ